MHALPCIFTLKLSHWWFVTLRIDIGLGIALYFTTRYSYGTYSKANGRQSPGRTPGWWCQCSATDLQQPDNHHPHNPSISTLHSLHFTSKHLDTMHAYVFGAAVSRSAAEHNFFEESVAHGLVYTNRQNYRLSPTHHSILYAHNKRGFVAAHAQFISLHWPPRPLTDTLHCS